MKCVLLVILTLMAPFALALSVPWDSLDGTQAQTVSPGQSIALNGATEWVLRVALPGFTSSKTEFTGALKLGGSSVETETYSSFKWYYVPKEGNNSSKRRFECEGTGTPQDVSGTGAYLEWHGSANHIELFVIDSEGKYPFVPWYLSSPLASYDWLSLEVSDATAFTPAQFMVITPDPSDPNAPEPGIVSFILLGGGVLLVLRRPSQRRVDR